jgi:hypothetical protein
MATKTIDALNSATTLTGAEELPVWQSGGTVKTTAQAIAALASGAVFDPADILGTYQYLNQIGGHIGGGHAGDVVQLFGDFSDGNTFLQNADVGAGNSANLLQRIGRREGSFYTAGSGGGAGAGNIVFRQTNATSLFRRPSGTPASPGGLFSFTRLGFRFPATAVTSHRFLCGFVPSNSLDIGAADGTFAALVNVMGIGKDDVDLNVFFIVNDASGAITKVDTGITFASLAGQLLEVFIYSDFAADSVKIILRNVDADTSVAHEFITQLPAADTGLYWANLWNEGYHVTVNNVQTAVSLAKTLWHMSI